MNESESASLWKTQTSSNRTLKPDRKVAFGIQLIKLDQRTCENFKRLTYVSEVEMCYEFFLKICWVTGRVRGADQKKTKSAKETTDTIKEGFYLHSEQ